MKNKQKIGFRIPSITKRIAARTSIKRVVRHNLGLKAPRGLGWVTNPKKALYNRVYSHTTRGCVVSLLYLLSWFLLSCPSTGSGWRGMFMVLPRIKGLEGFCLSTGSGCGICLLFIVYCWNLEFGIYDLLSVILPQIKGLKGFFCP